jgi:hypothetical protein
LPEDGQIRPKQVAVFATNAALETEVKGVTVTASLVFLKCLSYIGPTEVRR